MSYRGIARGHVIELEECLPFDDGQPVSVEVTARAPAERGTGAAVLEAVKAGPHVPSEDVEELMAVIRASKLPPSPPVEF